MKFIGRFYIRDRIAIFLAKHKDRILNIHNRYTLIQGKKKTLRLYYSGRVIIGSKKKLRFDEKKIRRYL